MESDGAEVNDSAGASSVSRGVITLAFGSKTYVEVARSLARSIRLNSPGAVIAIVSDFPRDTLIDDFDIVIPLEPNHPGLYHKLALDKYSPFDETMFIDSDCLVVRDLGPLWSVLDRREFAVAGAMVSSGTWFGADIEVLCDRLGVDELPKFNSGWIAWRRGREASEVFGRARSSWQEYRALGFDQFRATLAVADEPLIAIGMALAGTRPVPDDGSMMNTPIGLRGPLRVNTSRGTAQFMKYEMLARPAIVHFCGPHRFGAVYRRETAILRTGNSSWISRVLQRVIALVYAPLALTDRSFFWDTARRLRRAIDAGR